MREQSFVIERLLSAEPDEVFAAWGDAASMGVWMCPDASIRGATVEADFRVGGRFRIVMHGPDEDYVQHPEYLALDRPRRIVMEWISDWMPPELRRTRSESIWNAPAPTEPA